MTSNQTISIASSSINANLKRENSSDNDLLPSKIRKSSRDQVSETISALDLLKIELDNRNPSSSLTHLTSDITSKNGENLKFFRAIREEIAPGTILELTGNPGSGKTQLGYYLNAVIYLEHFRESSNGFSTFISTNQGFAPHRFEEIAEKVSQSIQNFDVEEYCTRIYFNQVSSYLELLACLHNLNELIESCKGEMRLVIIDSIAFPLKTLTGNERASAVYTIFHILRRFTEICNLSVILVNDSAVSIGEDGVVGQTSSFGCSFHHFVNSRLEMSKNGGGFDVKLSKSVHRPIETFRFLA